MVEVQPIAMPHDVRIIVNPVSGARGRDVFARRLAAMAAACGLRVELCRTQRAGDAQRLASDVRNACMAVVAIGGDGTVRETAAGLAGGTAALIPVPGGTENLLSRHFGFRADAEQIVAALRDPRPRAVDLGQAGEQPFAVVAGLGFDAEVVERLTAIRNGHITHLHYFWPIWRTFWGHRFPHFRVDADGRRVFEGRGMVFVGNLPDYSIGLKLLRRAVPDDGLLDLCIYECAEPARLLRHAWTTALGRHLDSRGVIYRQSRTIRVETMDRVPLELDGDARGLVGPAAGATAGSGAARAIEFSVRPSALRLLQPPAKAGRMPA